MAFKQATAAGFEALLTDIKDFAALQGWTLLKDDSEIILQAPNSLCVVGLKKDINSDRNYFNLELQGFNSLDSNKLFHEQVGAIPNYGFNGNSNTSDRVPRLTLADESMEYWLSISERRIALTVRVSNFYVSAYLGLLLPLGSPQDYPYPLFVGGNMSSTHNDFDIQHLWSDTSSSNSNYMFGSGSQIGSAKVKNPNGEWENIYHGGSMSGDPANYGAYALCHPFNGKIKHLGKTGAGAYPLHASLVVSGEKTTSPDSGLWLGYLEGIYATTHEDNFAEYTIDSAFVCFPNVFRSTAGQFFAMEMK
ncbi:hypothetical protein P3547_19935 [Vibrio parahaemolyticus]|nr:hypothetical protein [Vibrio parahaemolyticus]